MKEKADSHLKKAEKRLKGWSLFSNKYDSAAEDLEKAANNYKLAKCCERCDVTPLRQLFHPSVASPRAFLPVNAGDEAAQAFEKLAHCQNKIDSAHEAVRTGTGRFAHFPKIGVGSLLTRDERNRRRRPWWKLGSATGRITQSKLRIALTEPAGSTLIWGASL